MEDRSRDLIATSEVSVTLYLFFVFFCSEEISSNALRLFATVHLQNLCTYVR